MTDLDFQQIVARLGSQHSAFEEMCCQLARRTLSAEETYVRLHGAGGDGGVEAFADLPDGTRTGWQAKFVFNVDSLLTQATKSLIQAQKVHLNLKRYVICFPFDLTGPTGRPGMSGWEKFEKWRKERVQQSSAKGRELSIEAWSASTLRTLLLDQDVSGGMRTFFFDQTVLSPDWFSENLASAKLTAGPRYTPELNIETDLGKWFEGFGRGATWEQTMKTKVSMCREPLDRLASAASESKTDSIAPPWPEESRADAQSIATETRVRLDTCSDLTATDDIDSFEQCVNELEDLLGRLISLESRLAGDIEAQHGPGAASSPGFRQFMAEFEVRFPTANLDHVRDLIGACRELHDWLVSPSGSLAFDRVFVLAGAAGVGKTHGVCDMADIREREGLLSCVTFGHKFNGEPDPWTRLLESFGLPMALGRDGFLDALNAAGEASGSPLIICIDAINETRPLRFWRDHLAPVAQSVRTRPYLRLVFTCRTSFLQHCLPEDHGLPVIEHAGFAGREWVACKAFFEHYGLTPPVAPILQPELANPLYLRLVCETLRARGLDHLPSGWIGLVPVIRAFLEEKERQFALEQETSTGAQTIRGSLRAIVRAIAESREVSIPWSRAQEAILQAVPQASGMPVLQWLVGADLLIEDAATSTNDPFGDESAVRPAFERLGDFLVAQELLNGVSSSNLKERFKAGGLVFPLLKDAPAVSENSGVLSALSILIPELIPGSELPNLVDDDQVQASLVTLTIRSFPWRSAASLSSVSESLIAQALEDNGIHSFAMDAALSVSWQSSSVDAIWLSALLKKIPLAVRDAQWCAYLHARYESGGAVRRLIDATFELPLDQVSISVAERWATTLLWFTAAADRRIKDTATRAIVSLLVAHPQIIPQVLARMLDVDDEEVKERTLLSCYGALILSHDATQVYSAVEFLRQAFQTDPVAFDNALIRDLLRCIADLAIVLGALPDGDDPELTTRQLGTEWTLNLPSDEEITRWNDLPALAYSCLADDFFIYSMRCLRHWEGGVTKEDMGKLILKTVTENLGYEGSGSERYDRYMLGRFGGGRGKPKWAERIGKKYQWIAMYKLASRMWDHIERRFEPWESDAQSSSLILLEERKLDPTLPSTLIGNDRHANAWWIGSTADLLAGANLTDENWVKEQDDLPDMKSLLFPVGPGGQKMLTLCAFPSWGTREEGAPWGIPYRNVGVNLESYLVPKKDIRIACDSLQGRNSFGSWMPEGRTWHYGFAGEYPWAHPFQSQLEETFDQDNFGRGLPTSYMPSHEQLAVEWEYDASLPHSFHMLVPARRLFAEGDLWWNGRDGFQDPSGKTVFRDPSITEIGPGSLLAEEQDLVERLDRLGLAVLWTLVGEKTILGGPGREATPRRIFSQIACLQDDGSIEIGERVFFEDYEQNAEPSTT